MVYRLDAASPLCYRLDKDAAEVSAELQFADPSRSRSRSPNQDPRPHQVSDELQLATLALALALTLTLALSLTRCPTSCSSRPSQATSSA